MQKTAKLLMAILLLSVTTLFSQTFTCNITSPANYAQIMRNTVATITAAAPGAYKVKFYIDNQLVKTDYTAPFTANWTATIGNHPVKAVAYSSASSNAITATSTINLLGVSLPVSLPTCVITAPANNSSAPFGTTVNITTDVANADGGVEFFVDGTSIPCTMSSTGSQYEAVYTVNTVGTQEIKAVATGIYNVQAVSTISFTGTPAVVRPPSCEITEPLTNSTFLVGTTVQILASAGNASEVLFYADGVQLTSTIGANSVQYQAEWTVPTSGAHEIKAVAVGMMNQQAVSIITLNGVNQSITMPVCRITAPVADANLIAGSVVNITTEASYTNNVKFYVDDVLIAEDAEAPFEAAWTTSLNLTGSHIIKTIATGMMGRTMTSEVNVNVINNQPQLISLWSQMEMATETTPAADNIELAADFVLSANSRINIINVKGVQTTLMPFAETFTVKIYTNSSTNKPSTLLQTLTALPVKHDIYGTFVLKFNTVINLNAGKYWISFKSTSQTKLRTTTALSNNTRAYKKSTTTWSTIYDAKYNTVDLAFDLLGMPAGKSSAESENIVLNSEVAVSNYPNPFNPETTISFTLPANSNVKLAVYNARGEMVQELVNEIKAAGCHSVKFNAAGLNSGVYFYKLITPNTIKTQKMLLVK